MVSDGADQLERVLLRDFATRHISQKLGATKGAGAGQVVQDPRLATEIKEGTDKLLNDITEAHVVPGDKIELYFLMDYFSIPEGARKTVEAALAERAGRKQVLPSQVRTPEEEAAITSEIEELEAELKRVRRDPTSRQAGEQARHKGERCLLTFIALFSFFLLFISQQKKRSRALLKLHSLLSKRVPEAEAADKRLTEILERFSSVTAAGASASGEKIQEALPAFLAEAQELKQLCGRIATASTPVAAASSSSSSSSSALVPPPPVAVSPEEEAARSVGVGIGAALSSSNSHDIGFGMGMGMGMGPMGLGIGAAAGGFPSYSSSSSSAAAATTAANYAALLRQAEKEKASVYGAGGAPPSLPSSASFTGAASSLQPYPPLQLESSAHFVPATSAIFAAPQQQQYHHHHQAPSLPMPAPVAAAPVVAPAPVVPVVRASSTTQHLDALRARLAHLPTATTATTTTAAAGGPGGGASSSSSQSSQQ